MTIDIQTYSDADYLQRYLLRTIGGAPIDLGTDILRMMVRANAEQAAVFIERSSYGNDGIVITDAATGAFTLSIPVAMLVNLQPGVYVHSLIRTDSTFQARQEIWRGKLTHSAGPTRWKPGTFSY